jgi:KaiC/GvpD/RAD55 family RecA-like ATPase
MVARSAQNGEAAVPEPRVSTGNGNLDIILYGGFVARRPYLVVGPSGSGKTKLALSFLCEGVRRGERVLLVTLEEPPNEIRINHRALSPLLDSINVFDAIPDVMRYERAPFKDIAAVRHAVPFSEVPLDIRKTPELTSVEVTFTALEQTLKMEIARRNYTRLVIDSLTALQYFCMKGVDEVGGAQTFLRFLSDLGVTTILTVESPSEETETAERLLARGEVRLSRWDVDGQTVCAIGVEKFRGSAHDIRLHPYRISPTGLEIDLETTISRDTIRAGLAKAEKARERAATRPPSTLLDVVALIAAVRDLVGRGIDVRSAQVEVDRAAAASEAGRTDAAARHLLRARGIVSQLAIDWENAHRAGPPTPAGEPPGSERGAPAVGPSTPASAIAPTLPSSAPNAVPQPPMPPSGVPPVPGPVASSAPSAEPPAMAPEPDRGGPVSNGSNGARGAPLPPVAKKPTVGRPPLPAPPAAPPELTGLPPPPGERGTPPDTAPIPAPTPPTVAAPSEAPSTGPAAASGPTSPATPPERRPDETQPRSETEQDRGRGSRARRRQRAQSRRTAAGVPVGATSPFPPSVPTGADRPPAGGASDPAAGGPVPPPPDNVGPSGPPTSPETRGRVPAPPPSRSPALDDSSDPRAAQPPSQPVVAASVPADGAGGETDGAPPRLPKDPAGEPETTASTASQGSVPPEGSG